MSGKTEEFIVGIGALAEMSGILRDSLIANGFTRKEACNIVGIVISETLRSNNDVENDE